jgi:hypothetical protein
MRTAAAGLVKLSKQARPEGRTKVAAAMSQTVQSVRNQDRIMVSRLSGNAKATSQFVTLLERGDKEQRASMIDIVGQLNRGYAGQARHQKAKPEVKAAASALSGLKQRLANR